MRDASTAPRRKRFQRGSRLRCAADYRSVFSKHKKHSNQYFRVLVRYRDSEAEARLGIIVSRRVSRSAVQRNRIKRQMRECFRLGQEHFRSLDMVIIAHRSCVDATNRDLRDSLNNLFTRFKLCKKSSS